MAGVFVKGHQRGKSIVKAYTRNAQYKKGLSKTGRVQRLINKISGALGEANSLGKAKRSRSLNKRMAAVRAYAIARGI